MNQDHRKTFNSLPWVIGTIAIVAVILIYRTTMNQSTVSEDDKVSQSEAIQTETIQEPKATDKDSLEEAPKQAVRKIAYLELDSNQLDSLPINLRELHRYLTADPDFDNIRFCADFLTITNNSLNLIYQQIDPAYKANDDKMEGFLDKMIKEPKKSTEHFGAAAREFLRKSSILSQKSFPNLSGQVREIKTQLSDLNPNLALEDQTNRLEDFFDHSFVLLYRLETEIPKQTDA